MPLTALSRCRLLLAASIILGLLLIPAAASAQGNSQTGGYFYVVQRGDSWASLAWRNGITISQLQAANPLVRHPFGYLWVGDRLYIPGVAPAPAGGYWYVVRRGDTWNRVAQSTGVPVLDLWHANPARIHKNYWLWIGESLWIPARVPAPLPRPATPLPPATASPEPLPTVTPYPPPTATPPALLTPAVIATPTGMAGPTLGPPAPTTSGAATSAPSVAASATRAATASSTSTPSRTATTAAATATSSSDTAATPRAAASAVAATYTAAVRSTATSLAVSTATAAAQATASAAAATYTAAMRSTATSLANSTATAAAQATASAVAATYTAAMRSTATSLAVSTATAAAQATATAAAATYTAAMRPTAAPLAVSTATAAVRATATAAAAATARPAATAVAGCPADFTAIPDGIANYLKGASASATGLQAWLTACGAVKQGLGGVTLAGIQSAASKDMVVVIHDPAAAAESPVGMILVYHARATGYVLAGKATGTGQVDVIKVADLNQDKKVDIAWTDTTCGAHTCFGTLFVDSWDGTAYRDWIDGEPTMAFPDYSFKDGVPGASGLAILVHGGVISSAGAGPQRAWTETYISAEGSPYRLIGQEYDASTCLYHHILDANTALSDWAANGFQPAIQAYRAAIDDAGLQACGSIANELAVLRDFARFRLLLATVANGQSSGTAAAVAQIGTPAIQEAARAFANSYQSNGSLIQACRDTTQYATQHPDSWQYLADWGYANPSFSADELCPLAK